MTTLLAKAIETVGLLPPARQDEIAQAILKMAEDTVEPIDPGHLDDVFLSMEQARRGEFASEAEVAAVFRRFG